MVSEIHEEMKIESHIYSISTNILTHVKKEKEKKIFVLVKIYIPLCTCIIYTNK